MTTNSSLRFTGVCAGMMLVAAFAAACADSPSQPAQPRITARLEIVSGDGQTGAPGEELPEPLTVRAVDSAGHPVAGQIINFRVMQGGGSVFAGANVTGENGIALEYWTLGPRAGDPQVLEARAVDNSTGEKIVFGTFTATARSSTPASMTMSGLAGDATVGSTLPNPVYVYVRDAFNNPVPDRQVSWSVIQGNGRLTNAQGVTASTAVSTTDAQGRASVRFTPGTVAGTNVVRAVAGSVEALGSINGLPASPYRFTVQPAELALPAGTTGQLVGHGYDRFNNRVPYIGKWRSLDPGIVTVLSPSSMQADTLATIRGVSAGAGRVVGQINAGTKVWADTVVVTVH